MRFAQFNSQIQCCIQIRSRSHIQHYFYFGPYKVSNRRPAASIIPIAATADIARSFRGIGPSISWNASAPVIGNPANGQVVLDWGVNAAILFGRQKARVHHQTTGRISSTTVNFTSPVVPQSTYRRRSTTCRRTTCARVQSRYPISVALRDLTFRLQNFKVSAGYRADLFFGAMDGGIETAKKENRGFYGPFASVSVGIGG